MSANSTKRIMMIGAHQDDCELKTGGTALKLVACGHTVKFVSATNGDTGHHMMGGGQLAKVRLEEMKRSTAIGNIECEVLDIHNNEIEPSVMYRKMFIKCIREFRPDMIITHRPYDYHPDHRITSTLVQDSVFGLTIPNVCPLIPRMEKMPVVMYMYDYFTKPIVFMPDIVVGIDDVLEKKVQMVNEHKSQVYGWLPWINKWDTEVPECEEARIKWLYEIQKKRDAKVVEKFKQTILDKYGDEGKFECAEAFEICEYGSAISQEEIQQFFPFL